MSLDYQAIREQVKLLGENALGRAKQLQDRRAQALELLVKNAQDADGLHQKIETVVRNTNIWYQRLAGNASTTHRTCFPL